jgi:3-deoxy-D-manno-octulosonate 8-phosphate phosphatase (KDO 8-P phosphatase)
MKARLKKVKLLIMDVDGVLTDGRIIVDDDGRETKFFNVQDGFGIVAFRRAGFRTAILSARASKVVGHRARDLGIDRVCLDAFPKIDAYEKILKDFKLKDENVCFIGDDWPDVEVLGRVGFAVSVPNGTKEARQAAHHITRKKGGGGAVREVIELIMRAQSCWPPVDHSRRNDR